ncbi:hypothetical protein K493DRAFT_406943 [Basidiobolus meristosporus CBS 931.73]|uniref:Uncharacterized protein n=1 Tax=Basidiobolus meristosporus CBS 931.73 TaxID=1314790 RepID=A0A1Y1YI76_9FUNG|nr:hypothetical protein K493DRAFT_406943 [Basidiobolus meristosporus CBS 931.73]|eukprot:ORX97416.1 hypothetical protein K493DRAFT_406943 [Basidiobolus meristosporus CBS 931.73]
MWIVLCILTSLHLIRIHRTYAGPDYPTNSNNVTSEVLSDIAQWFLSSPIPYGYSMGWQISHSLKVEAHTVVVAMLAWQFVIVATSGVFALLVRRAYLAEQRNWDGLDNWAI